MKHRPFVKWAADRMEETLRRKEALEDPVKYGPWEILSHQDRWEHAIKEQIELSDAITECVCEEKRTPKKIGQMQREAYDVAITAFMVAGGFEPRIKHLRRGKEIKDEQQ